LLTCLLIAAAVPGIAVYHFANCQETSLESVLIAIGVAALLEFVFLLGVLVQLPRWTVLKADADRLLVTTRSLFGFSQMEIPSDRIREVRIGSDSSMAFCTDGIHHFAHGSLSLVERRWIENALVHVMGGRNPR
jgi:hypothetical protein